MDDDSHARPLGDRPRAASAAQAIDSGAAKDRMESMIEVSQAGS